MNEKKKEKIIDSNRKYELPNNYTQLHKIELRYAHLLVNLIVLIFITVISLRH